MAGLKLLTAFLEKNTFYAKPGQVAITVLHSTDAMRAQIQKAEEAIKKSELLPKSLAQPARVKKIATRMTKEAKLLDQMYLVHRRRECCTPPTYPWPAYTTPPHIPGLYILITL